MNISGPALQIVFLGVFNIVGGLGMGFGLRTLIREHSLRGAFFIVWGSIFGGVPCLIGARTLLAAHYEPLYLVNPILFLSAIALSMTILPELVQDMGTGPLIATGVGAVFMLVGVIVGMSSLRQGSLAGAIAGGGVFTLAGGLVFALGINMLIRGKQAQ